jgi:hypothetical protein
MQVPDSAIGPAWHGSCVTDSKFEAPEQQWAGIREGERAMELKTVTVYLLALALPLWLLVEQVMHWQSSPKQPAKRFQVGKLPGKPASGAPITGTRPRAMRAADQRKTA